MESSGDSEMSRSSNEAAAVVYRASDSGPIVGMTLLFVALLVMGWA
jgi:hypothetical protein